MAALEVASAITETIGLQWFVTASPGPYFTGHERLSMAEIIREDPETAGQPHGLALEAALRVAHAATSIDEAWIEELEQLGLPRGPFVEIVGVVARVVAIDTFVRGVGANPLPLPDPLDGAPTGTIEVGARQRTAYVPILEPAAATTALSLLPSESAARRDLQAALYLDDAKMGDSATNRELSRPQMELLAAHTSWLNKCFYSLLAHASMLRASVDSITEFVDLLAITDPSVDSRLPYGKELLAFNRALVLRTDDLDQTRDNLVAALGEPATVRAAGVIATFDMMNRIMDATGIPIPNKIRAISPELGLRDSDLPRH